MGNFIKYSIVILTVLFSFNVCASELPESEAQSLAYKYRPILELHPDEIYIPINVKNIASNPYAIPRVVLHRDGYDNKIVTESLLDNLGHSIYFTSNSFLDLPDKAYEGMQKDPTVYYRVFYNLVETGI